MNVRRSSVAFVGMLFLMLGVADLKIIVNNEKEVVDDVLESYPPVTRPVKNVSDTIVVEIGIEIQNVHSYEPDTGELDITALIRLMWRDGLVRWDPELFRYAGVRIISLPSTSVWTPDITVDNLINPWLQLTPDRLVIEADGYATWVRKLRLRTMCEPEVKEETTPPIFTCHMRFISWTYFLSQMDIEHTDSSALLTSYVKSGQWRVINATVHRKEVHYACCIYPEVVLSMELRSGAASSIKPSFGLVILRILFVGVAVATSQLSC